MNSSFGFFFDCTGWCDVMDPTSLHPIFRRPTNEEEKKEAALVGAAAKKAASTAEATGKAAAPSPEAAATTASAAAIAAAREAAALASATAAAKTTAVAPTHVCAHFQVQYSVGISEVMILNISESTRILRSTQDVA